MEPTTRTNDATSVRTSFLVAGKEQRSIIFYRALRASFTSRYPSCGISHVATRPKTELFDVDYEGATNGHERSSRGIKRSYMLNKWIPLSLRRAETSGIKLRVKYPRCSHRSHCARHSRVSRNFQSNVWNARGHLHRMPRRGNNAWPQGSKGILSRVSSSFPFPPPLTATVVAGRGVSARRAFLKAPSYP